MNSKKLFAGVIAVAMAVVAAAPAAKAATAEELAAQIAQLQAQLASLMGQLGTTTPGTVSSTAPAACAGISFTRNLTLGSQGTDVQCLQAILNQDPATQVAASGVGSAGNETMYFGGLTRAAVVAFQNKYAAEVLTPVGLTAGTGFVGAHTRAKLNAMLAGAPSVVTPTEPGTSGTTLPAGCTSTAGYSPVTGEPCSSTTTSTGAGLTITGEEGSITVSVNPVPANNVKTYEGDEKVAVYGMKIQATGSDVDVQRVTLRFNAQPWSYMSNVYLYDGDTQIASSPLNSSTVSRVTSSDFQITLTGFTSKVIVAKGASRVLTVKVDILPGLSSGLVGASIQVGLPSATAVRAIDQAGLNQYGGLTDTRLFTVNASLAADATLAVSLNANTPKARNLIADASGYITEATLMSFDLRSTKDNILIDQINNVQFTVKTDGSVYRVPTTVYLVDDAGTTISTATPVACSSNTDCSNDNAGKVSFTDLNYTVARDTTKTLTIKVDDQLGTVDSNTRVIANVDGKKYEATITAGANIVATLSNGANLADGKKTGTAVSNGAFVYGEGPVFTLASITTSSTQSSHSGASSTISATFNIQVKAENGDVYIPKTAAFVVKYGENGDEAGAVSGVTYVQPSGMISDTNAYKLASGSTATFAVSATQPGTAKTYDLRLDQIKWAHTDVGAGSAITSDYMAGESTWFSNAVYLQ